MALPINEIVCGDCVEVMKTFPDASIDLVVTSPPYFNIQKKYQRGTGVHYSMDVGEPLYVILDCSEVLLRKMRPEGFYCLNLGFSYGETGVLRPFYIIQRLLRQKWFVLDVVIWHKLNPIPIKDRLTNAFEYVFILAKHPLTKYPSKPSYKHNVFDAAIARSKGFSSAPFPEDLPKFFIEVFSDEDSIVFDPFVGSGTTCAVAKKLSRKWIGIDINPDYVEMARERLSEIPDKLSTFLQAEYAHNRS